MSRDTLIPAHPEPPALPLPFPLTLTRGGLSGFPSPAQDYEGRTLDLNERLVKRAASTFFMTVTGDSMEALGIHAGDLLVIDSAIDPRPGHILVASVEGELVVKRYELLAVQSPYPAESAASSIADHGDEGMAGQAA
jgi:DNA polymerase V